MRAPAAVRAGAAQVAETRGQAGQWIVANTRSSVEPFLTYSERRDLREKAWRMFVNRGDNGGATDNHAIISEILQLRAAREVVRRELSVRETERLVRRLQNPPRKHSRAVDPDIQRLQDQLAEKLCAKVSIQHGRKGKGKLVIAYNSPDELEGIIGHLKGDG